MTDGAFGLTYTELRLEPSRVHVPTSTSLHRLECHDVTMWCPSVIQQVSLPSQ